MASVEDMSVWEGVGEDSFCEMPNGETKKPMSTFKDGDFGNNLQDQRDEILALQSIFNTDDEENVVLMSEVTSDEEGLFSLQIEITVKPIAESVTVNIVVPDQENDEEELMGATATPQLGACPLTVPKNVELNRSLSGRNWVGQLEVKYLPPVSLYITFPATYPSSTPPVVFVSGAWLSPAQVQVLTAELEALWHEGMSMPIVFTWVDWVENSVLSHLGIVDSLILTPSSDINDELKSNGNMTNPKGKNDAIGALLAAMVCFNREKMDIEFCQTLHECHVCYDEKMGDLFFRLKGCDHHFCHDCMLAYCDMHVKEGTVEELRCPESDCDTLLPPYIVQAVLGPADYEKWERLLLQKTLDAMSDTIYCPRCQSVVIVEDEEKFHLGHCPLCFFAFCTECEHLYHPGQPCGSEEKELATLKNKNPSGLSAAEKERYDQMKRDLEEKIANKQILQQKTVVCPSCKIRVEKIGGCNKMTCKCGSSFCWVCRKTIHGYAHFQEGCVLFPGQQTANEAAQRAYRLIHHVPDAVLRIRARLQVNPELEDKQAFCPSCKQRNLKADRNNHIKCWNCKGNFCFECKKKIVGSVAEHFRGTCDQHS